MTWELSQQERDGVLSAPPRKQYEHFVKKVADEQEVWLLTGAETHASIRVDDRSLLLAWPHRGYVEGQAVGAWEGYEPECVEVHDFLGVLEELAADGTDVAVMHRSADAYVGVSAADLARDIQAELDLIE